MGDKWRKMNLADFKASLEGVDKHTATSHQLLRSWQTASETAEIRDAARRKLDKIQTATEPSLVRLKPAFGDAVERIPVLPEKERERIRSDVRKGMIRTDKQALTQDEVHHRVDGLPMTWVAMRLMDKELGRRLRKLLTISDKRITHCKKGGNHADDMFSPERRDSGPTKALDTSKKEKEKAEVTGENILYMTEPMRMQSISMGRMQSMRASPKLILGDVLNQNVPSVSGGEVSPRKPKVPQPPPAIITQPLNYRHMPGEDVAMAPRRVYTDANDIFKNCQAERDFNAFRRHFAQSKATFCKDSVEELSRCDDARRRCYNQKFEVLDDVLANNRVLVLSWFTALKEMNERVTVDIEGQTRSGHKMAQERWLDGFCNMINEMFPGSTVAPILLRELRRICTEQEFVMKDQQFCMLLNSLPSQRFLLHDTTQMLELLRPAFDVGEERFKGLIHEKTRVFDAKPLQFTAKQEDVSYKTTAFNVRVMFAKLIPQTREINLSVAPYVSLKCESRELQSSTKHNSLTPIWNESFQFPISPTLAVSFTIYNQRVSPSPQEVEDGHPHQLLATATVVVAYAQLGELHKRERLPLKGASRGYLEIEYNEQYSSKPLGPRPPKGTKHRPKGLRTQHTGSPTATSSPRRGDTAGTGTGGAGTSEGTAFPESLHDASQPSSPPSLRTLDGSSPRLIP
eukprot:NODE_557_length_2325_cov_19.186194_g529_i0.p1 GENE.NODE_557_length_2325_cov_19.186194_g529_i0~~NODE_557_length_2325_cov_19.186194_g529_i0.p1  ORF type:complete len:685 (+),score=157.77 NODE_557_length_2325_cov_19.186194_g529_i0:80-2134(+)